MNNINVDPMFNLMSNPVDDRKTALGWKRHFDYIIPKVTEVRKSIYGETFDKIQSVRQWKLGCTSASLATTYILTSITLHFAQFGKWASDYQAAWAGKVTDLFGTPPVDPYPRQGGFACGDDYTGNIAPSPLYKFREQIESKYLAHWFGYVGVLIGVITVVPFTFWCIERWINSSTEKEIDQENDIRAMALRNKVIEQHNNVNAEDLINNRNAFTALFRFGKSGLIDAIYESTLPYIRDRAKPEESLPPVSKDRDIVDISWLGRQIGSDVTIRNTLIRNRGNPNVAFTGAQLEETIQSLEKDVLSLKTQAGEAAAKEDYKTADVLQQKQQFWQGVVNNLTTVMKERADFRSEMEQLRGRIVEIRETNALKKMDDVEKLRLLLNQERKMARIWTLIHDDKFRTNLWDNHVKEIRSLNEEINWMQTDISSNLDLLI
jgi:hypothetical protein